MLATNSPLFLWSIISNWQILMVGDPTLYRKLIGYLMYLAIARLDKIYAINISWLSLINLILMLPVTATRLCYLKGSPAQGILLGEYVLWVTQRFPSSLWLRWASCPTSHHSTTSYGIDTGDCPISWKTKKQPLFLILSLNPNIESCHGLLWVDLSGFPHCKPTKHYCATLCKFRL